jgi:hypothetical protein
MRIASFIRTSLVPREYMRRLLLGIVVETIVLPVMSTFETNDRTDLWTALVADGLPLLAVGSLGLIVSGAFAWFLAVTNQLLPHDVAWLTISEAQLRASADGRLLDFMDHDRAAFGGTLIAIGLLYLWLVRFPIAEGRAWAWWTLAGSATVGFLSFLTYVGTGYLDTWHGAATLVLLPTFGVGLWLSRDLIQRHAHSPSPEFATVMLGLRAQIGRSLLLLVGFGMLVAGLTIATIGSFVVFVPQDLEFLRLDRAALDALDPHLVPLIAHDRAGFGGGLATAGMVVLAVVWFGRPSRALWETLTLAGMAGFGAAVGVHGLIGYTDLTHVGPAILAAVLFGMGMILVRPMMWHVKVAGPH